MKKICYNIILISYNIGVGWGQTASDSTLSIL